MIRKLLEKNRKFINYYKEEHGDNNNEIVLLLLFIFVGFVILFSSPIFLLLIIINYIYKLYNKIFPINIKKVFNRDLLNYEKKLNKLKSYYLLKYIHNDKLSYQDFIYNFIRDYNYYYQTMFNNDIVCDLGRRRSLGDIYLITKHYYPDIRLETVLKELLYLVKGNIISVQKCSNIGRHVYTYGRGYNGKSEISEFTSLTFKQIEEIYD